MMFGVLLALGLGGWAISSLIDNDDSSDSEETYGLNVENGTSSADDLEGTNSNDWIRGEGGKDSISGGAGNDLLQGGGEKDLIDGGSGNDLIDGGYWADTISGGAGDDAILGNSGQDVLKGDEGNDALLGGAGSDVLEGGAGNDILNGGFEDQKADGSGTDLNVDFAMALAKAALEAPELFEGSEDDLLNSSYFKDVDLDDLKKGPGADGSDTLIGGDGNDSIYLRSGDIGWGDDVEGTFRGSDTFYVNAGETGDAALISDFLQETDKLVIEHDEAKGVPELSYKISSDELHVTANGNLILRIEDMGDLSAVPSFELRPVSVS